MITTAILWFGAGFAGYLLLVVLIAYEDGWKTARKVMVDHKLSSAIVCLAFSMGGPVTLLLAINSVRTRSRTKFFWD